MASPHLQLNREDCSEIGLLVLDYIDAHQLTFTQMVERVEISRAALRVVCLKRANPGKSTVSILSEVLGVSEPEFCRLVCENKIKLMYEKAELVELVLSALDLVLQVVQNRLEELDDNNLAHYDLYAHALKVVTSFP